ncbi:unnamed protein product [Cylindrotheca closterium]|uniref:Uncharacterized protein n=1 Tax=Cylindrotheca closterium TaxID=2856 RepID=A0AAD2CI03_9STRA|nr:unnamed protein product [Cylindrotheca closterium]
MLEETLSSPTYSPAEAALALISFVEVELAAGGPSAEARFFKLFDMLCDRVFGTISDGSSNTSNDINNSNANTEYRHQTGGWLSRHVRWERPRQTQVTANPHQHHGRRPVPSVSTDPVVKLLGAKTTVKTHSDQATALTLVEAMAKEAEHRPNVRYPFPFKALPKSTQTAWLALLERAIVEEVNAQANAFGGLVSSTTPTAATTPQHSMMSPPPPIFPSTPSTPTANNPVPGTTASISENAERLLGSVFCVKPREQHQLRSYQQSISQKKNHHATRPLQLSPIMYNNNNANNLRSPLGSNNNIIKSKERDASKPKIMLSMLEYYLVLFLRYPIAAPLASEDDRHKPPMSSSSRRSEAYGDSVYYYLFQEYTNYYIPVRAPQGHANTGFSLHGMNRPTELFLRICLALWLEGQNQIEPNTKSLDYLKEKKGILDPDFVFDLNFSYDLVKKVSSYQAPPFQVQRCLHKLVTRAVSDGALADVVRDTTAGLRGGYPETLCVSPVLHIMQLPFYNYIRAAFRHASIHTRQSPFYTALNDWLVWLEPWNTKYGYAKKDPKQRLLDSLPRNANMRTASTPTVTMTYPKANQRSLYKPEWEAYIAANLHMYIVPLAIFLRRARELDFSPKFYRQSLDAVLKVFRVFSPEVVQVINKLLTARGVGQIGAQLSGIVAAHERNLGDYAPPSNALSLLSCQNDMHNLLEEIYLQHLKKMDSQDFFDRMISRFDAKMDSWFGGNATATNEATKLKMLVGKAKVIVGFPADYEVMPESRAASMEAQALGMVDPSNDRTTSGTLTDAGRERILRGNVKCNPEDVDYYGDRMLGRVQTHEVELLVSLLVKASQLINAKLGLNPKPNPHSMIPRRFNLRFLADWRNVMTIIIVYRFLKLVI